jgi:hypothetical protein
MQTIDPGWVQLLVAFVGGSLMTAVITAFVKNWLVHPVISVCIDEKRGSYETTEAIHATTGQSLEAKYLRLHVENTGFSSIRACCGYIIGITKRAGGTAIISKQEVITLGWANHGLGARDIPRGAFFHLDVIVLFIDPSGRTLSLTQNMPNTLAHLFSGEIATYEFEILIAADNARPRRIPVEFTYDPGSDDLKLEPLDKARYPWWMVWRWRPLRQRR